MYKMCGIPFKKCGGLQDRVNVVHWARAIAVPSLAVTCHMSSSYHNKHYSAWLHSGDTLYIQCHAISLNGIGEQCERDMVSSSCNWGNLRMFKVTFSFCWMGIKRQKTPCRSAMRTKWMSSSCTEATSECCAKHTKSFAYQRYVSTPWLCTHLGWCGFTLPLVSVAEVVWLHTSPGAT